MTIKHLNRLPPLSEPNAKPGRPGDNAPDVQRRYRYQSAVGALLLCDAVRTDEYREFWFEHKDDILGVRSDGGVDVFQVKTRLAAVKWTARDPEMVKTLAHFGQLEQRWGQSIERYLIYSNVAPYLPGESGTDEKRKSKSLPLLKQWVNAGAAGTEGCQEAFDALIDKTGLDAEVLAAVLGKLHFMVGPALESLHETIATGLAGVQALGELSVGELNRLAKALLQNVEDAAGFGLPGNDVFTSVMSEDGNAQRQIDNKRIEVVLIRMLFSRLLVRKRRRARLHKAAFIAGVCALAGTVIWLNHRPQSQSYLEKAFDTMLSSRNGALPPEFPQAVSAVRSASVILDGLSLDGAMLQCQDLSRLQMIRMSARALHGTGVNFNGSHLSMSDLSAGELNSSSFAGAILEDARFEKSNMLSANFTGAAARRADFSGASLTAASFASAKLSSANFTGVDLRLAEFQGADLTGANLQGANLAQADLSDANLKGAKGLDQAMLDQSCAAAGQLPQLDAGMKATMPACFNNAQEREQRDAMRKVTAAIGQLTVMGGYCKDGKMMVRPANGSGIPEYEVPFYLELRPRQ